LKDEDIIIIREGIVRLETLSKVMAEDIRKLTDENSEAHKIFYTRTDDNRRAIDSLTVSLANHKTKHTDKHLRVKGSKSTIALVISGLAAIILFFKSILPWLKAHH